jgi:TrmH family RNA methyltransferase
MVARNLFSLQHPLVKHLVKLRESRACREESQEILLVGEEVVREVATRLKVNILITERPLDIEAKEIYIASSAVLKKITGTDDLVAATLPLPKSTNLLPQQKIVVLEGLQDPGNVGTILRTALALGWDGAFLTPGTADPFNDKALRASRGAPLFLPLQYGPIETLGPRSIYVADVRGVDLTKVDFKKPLALILGHETRGPSLQAKQAGQLVKISMQGPVESLNVATAAAIFIYHIGEKHVTD